MTIFHDLKDRFVASGPDSVSGRRRLRRWQLVRTAFPDLERMQVLDLGGTIEAWDTAGIRPAGLVLLNPFEERRAAGVEVIQGDACDPPDQIAGRRFDLVFSNSVIEHVGGHARRQGFARTALAHGGRLWVQTPYRYFPVEPHFVAPGLQFLPLAARARALRAWPLIDTHEEAQTVARLQDVELLSITEMRAYFPGCRLEIERFAGLPKSLIAIR